MDSFIAHWNGLSEEARQIIIMCGATQIFVMLVMMRLLSKYDKERSWNQKEELESQEIG